MPDIRVMFVGHGASNLPEDRIVNTFHFSVGAGTAETLMTQAFEALTTFYNSPAPSYALSAYLSPWVQRSAEFRAYDLSQTPPRVPVIEPITLAASNTASGLPEEVAIVTTLQGAVPPALTARRRGRLYIGPLNNNTITPGTSSTPSRPDSVFTDIIGYTCARLVIGNVGWCIRSSVPFQNFVQIADGYVDNAFDTQRRRGPETTARTPWPVG